MYDVTVIGGGPAGLAAALEACKEGAKVLLIEREKKLGGILKQCIHDGFGLLTFGERLSGPEYVERYIETVKKSQIEVLLQTFVTEVTYANGHPVIHFVNRNGASNIETRAIVLTTGCRERTAKQVFIHGTRPSGIFTAGTAQYYVNCMGKLPVDRCVILGSGDIGLIMARRLTLEGAHVLGVYEAKAVPSGLTRNIHQCLRDFHIPLYLSHTVTRVFGDERLSAIEVAQVDEAMQPIEGTEEIIACDGLILSVGLIPENELAETMGVLLDPKTKGPVCDQLYRTNVQGVYCAGNALHVNDLVDYVSESAAKAGRESARYALGEPAVKAWVPVEPDRGVAYVIPSNLDISSSLEQIKLYFRCQKTMQNARLRIFAGEKLLLEKRYKVVRPPEMECLTVDFSKEDVEGCRRITVTLEEAE